ncbi:unnamed protein product [Moneuplotes crassus]|uniref:Uncharacterized protein n=2 Tax=Euplotes crassus TaxID=5936 RepID=A0AAD1UAY2_EUPCR|nr:unnamed protein product [Moneuplotes crassus]
MINLCEQIVSIEQEILRDLITPCLKILIYLRSSRSITHTLQRVKCITTLLSHLNLNHNLFQYSIQLLTEEGRRPSTSSSSSSSSDSNRITITSSMLESSETPIEEFKPENLPKKPIRDKRVRFNFEQKDSEALKPKVKKSLLKKHHSQFNFESDWPKSKKLTLAWIAKSLFSPIELILLNKTQSLNFNMDKADNTLTRTGQTRIMYKIKTYIDKILFAIVENTRKHLMGTVLLKYFKEVTTEGLYVASQIFTDFELARVKISKSRELCEVKEWQKKMILAMFIIGKIFVINIIINNDTKGTSKMFSSKPNDIQKKNLKIIGSIIYYKLLEYLRNNTKIISDEKASPEDDVISESLIPYKHLKPLVDDKLWSEYISGIFHTWLTQLIDQISTKF